MIKPRCFDIFDSSPHEAIAEAFGEMRIVNQADVESSDGKLIDMSFFRNTGLPIKQTWLMKDWNITFNTIHAGIPAVTPILDANIPDFIKSLKETQRNIFDLCLCLQFSTLDETAGSYELMCIDRGITVPYPCWIAHV